MTWLEEMGRFLTDTRLDDVPEDVLADARMSLMDTIGCMLGGMTAAPVRRLARRMALPGGRSPILGSTVRASASRAALVGGVAATWLDLDTGHRHPAADPPVPAVHPPVHTLPAVVSLAAEHRLTGADLLRIHLVSYELGARLGIATRLRPGLHPHGVQPTVAAAAAAALTRGGDVTAAMRVAASLCTVAPLRTALDGATVRNAYAGVGAANGVLADQLAVAGIVPQRAAFERTFGEVVSTELDPGLLMDGLGREWETTRGYYKVHACCRWNHPALDAIEDIRAEGPVDPADIDTVDVDTFAFAAAMAERAPRSDMGAKFSIPWAVAASLTLGASGREAFDDTALSRPDATALASRVTVREDPAFSRALPARRPTRVTVRLRDGGTRSAVVQGSRGDPGERFAPGTLEVKFEALAGAVLGADAAARAAASLADVERVGDVCELLELLTPDEREA